MTDQISDEDDLHDQKHLHYSDAFTRAKRNLLAYASVTILVGLATEIGKVTIPLLGSEAKIEKWLVLTLLWLATTFMFAGYLRSTKMLLHTNSQALFNEKFDSIRAVIRKLDAKLRLWNGEGKIAKIEASRLKILLESFSDPTQPLMKDFPTQSITPEVMEVIGTLWGPSALGRDDRVAGMGQTLTKHQNNWAEMTKTVLLTNIENARTELDAANDEFEIFDQRNVELTATIYHLNSNFSKLHQSIGVGDRKWFFWYDQVPCWSMWLIATAIWMWSVYIAPWPADCIQLVVSLFQAPR